MNKKATSHSVGFVSAHLDTFSPISPFPFTLMRQRAHSLNLNLNLSLNLSLSPAIGLTDILAPTN
ncbi:MAG: hypothetical protein R6U84_10255, partial [Candidatus Cloacimonadales bacterium]